jgi:hypothetical protein
VYLHYVARVEPLNRERPPAEAISPPIHCPQLGGSHSLFYPSFWAPEATACPAPCCFIRPLTSKLTSPGTAKAAIKKYIFSDTVDWVVLIGSYWIHLPFGPVTEAQLASRALKPSPGVDWLERCAEERRRSGHVPPLPELFLLCEDDSRKRLESIFASTDGKAQTMKDALWDLSRDSH